MPERDGFVLIAGEPDGIPDIGVGILGHSPSISSG